MTFFCDENDLRKYLLDDYIKSAEGISAGISVASIENASREVAEILSKRYIVPIPAPAVIRRICAVIAAYRIVCAITSLVNTEASSSNDFLPLQRMYTESMELLDDIAKGKLTIGGLISVESSHMAVVTREREFDLRGF